MTKIRSSRSSNVEDRRGQSGGGGGGMFGGGGGGGGGLPFPLPGGGGGGGGGLGLPGGLKMGGGMIGILLMLAVFILPKLMKGGLSNASRSEAVPSPQVAPPEQGEAAPVDPGGSGSLCDTEAAQIVCGAVDDVQLFWQNQFKSAGKEYQDSTTVLFSGSTPTGCGQGNAQTGPFYCPADSGVYIDLDFMAKLQDMLGAKGDLATQYIIAHEYGHHVQNVLGISDQVHQIQQQNPGQANEYSVRLELQADCLAGVWANDANKRNQFDGAAEIEEAFTAAEAVGDDRIQQKTQGRIDEEAWTHGSAKQRKDWFNKGFKSGNSDSCDTFRD